MPRLIRHSSSVTRHSSLVTRHSSRFTLPRPVVFSPTRWDGSTEVSVPSASPRPWAGVGIIHRGFSVPGIGGGGRDRLWSRVRRPRSASNRLAAGIRSGRRRFRQAAPETAGAGCGNGRGRGGKGERAAETGAGARKGGRQARLWAVGRHPCDGLLGRAIRVSQGGSRGNFTTTLARRRRTPQAPGGAHGALDDPLRWRGDPRASR